MSAIELKSVTFQDKRYEGASVTFNEEKHEAEVTSSKKRLGRTQKTSVSTFAYDAKTKVNVDGNVVSVKDLRMEASSEDDARLLASLIGKPSEEAKKRLHDALAQAEESVLKFLDVRGDAISFLVAYKSNPRNALLALPREMLRDTKADPVESVMSSYSERLSKALEEMKSSLTERETTLGPRLTGRLYAIAYATGMEQDALLRGDGTASEQVWNFLAQLGIEKDETTELSPAGLPKMLFNAAAPSLSLLSEESQ